MKLIKTIVLLLFLLTTTAYAIPPTPPSSMPSTCNNGEVAVWNSTTHLWDTCGTLAGGGDMLAATYVAAGKIKASTGGTRMYKHGMRISTTLQHSHQQPMLRRY
jgi:hypothetical protein